MKIRKPLNFFDCGHRLFVNLITSGYIIGDYFSKHLKEGFEIKAGGLFVSL